MLATIPPDLEAFIQSEIANGKYASTDEAISEAVRLLRDREHQLDVLRGEIEVGMSAIARGDVITIRSDADRLALIEDIQRRGRERLQSAQGHE